MNELTMTKTTLSISMEEVCINIISLFQQSNTPFSKNRIQNNTWLMLGYLVSMARNLPNIPNLSNINNDLKQLGVSKSERFEAYNYPTSYLYSILAFTGNKPYIFQPLNPTIDRVTIWVFNKYKRRKNVDINNFFQSLGYKRGHLISIEEMGEDFRRFVKVDNHSQLGFKLLSIPNIT